MDGACNTLEAMAATRDEVMQALAAGKGHRRYGVTAGLYSLSSLGEFSRLGPGLPVIRKENPPTFRRAANVDEFRTRLARAVPFLSDFDLQRYGMRLAGGAVSSLLMRGELERGQDLDLYLVGHTVSTARDAIRVLGAYLYALWEKDAPPGADVGAMIYRTEGCVTFYHRPAPGASPQIVQVVLRLYTTAAEVLHGFDMGSCAAMWDGQEVWVTALGRLAAERGANVLDLTAWRATYEYRLAKYFGRGYDLVLPHLNVSALDALAYPAEAELPRLGVNGLRWAAARLQAGSMYRVASPSSAAESYDGSPPYGDPTLLLTRNLRAYARYEPRVCGVNASLLCAAGRLGEHTADPLGVQPDMDAPSVAALLEQHLGLVVVDGPAEAAPVRAAHLGLIDVPRLSKLIGPHNAAGLLIALLQPAITGPYARLLIQEFSQSHAAGFKDRAMLPLTFMKSNTAFDIAGTPPTLSEWYGPLYNGC